MNNGISILAEDRPSTNKMPSLLKVNFGPLRNKHTGRRWQNPQLSEVGRVAGGEADATIVAVGADRIFVDLGKFLLVQRNVVLNIATIIVHFIRFSPHLDCEILQIEAVERLMNLTVFRLQIGDGRFYLRCRDFEVE